MQIEQAIRTPFGINAFGSAIIRVDPDIASLNFAVSRLEQQPKEAFRVAHLGARAVRDFLTQAKIKDVGASRITLSQTSRYSNGETRFVGYTARVAFHIVINDLDSIEEILIGIIEAGANQITSVDFQTSRLKELRAEARRRAIQAAHEKAENYCGAAGIKLGPIIHIEDINPAMLSRQEGHVTRETPPDDEGTPGAFNPESIVVGGAALVAFEIGR